MTQKPLEPERGRELAFSVDNPIRSTCQCLRWTWSDGPLSLMYSSVKKQKRTASFLFLRTGLEVAWYKQTVESIYIWPPTELTGICPSPLCRNWTSMDVTFNLFGSDQQGNCEQIPCWLELTAPCQRSLELNCLKICSIFGMLLECRLYMFLFWKDILTFKWVWLINFLCSPFR